MHIYLYICIYIYVYIYTIIYAHTYKYIYTSKSVNLFSSKHNHNIYRNIHLYQRLPFQTQPQQFSTQILAILHTAPTRLNNPRKPPHPPFYPTCAHLFLPPQKKPPFFTQQHWKSIPVPIRLNSPRKIHLLPYYPEIFPYRANPSKPNLPIMIKRPETGDWWIFFFWHELFI